MSTNLQSQIDTLKQQRNGHMDKLRQLTDECANLRKMADKYRQDSIAAQREAERYRALLGIALDGLDSVRGEIQRGL